jgi:hypothetical protein
MRKTQEQTTDLKKHSVPLRRQVQESPPQNPPVAAPAVGPEVAYRRAQVNSTGPKSADLLSLQRTVGNRAVQRMLARRADAGLVQRFAIYRGGPHEAANYVPQIPRDMSGRKRGLSTFENIQHIPPRYRPAQKIETDNLGADLEAVRNGSGADDSHVSIVPTNDKEVQPPPTTSKKQQKVTYEKLTAWAQEGVKSPYTAAVMSARQEEVK